MVDLLLIGSGLLGLLFFSAFGLLSLHESAGRAAIISFISAILLSAFVYLALSLPSEVKTLILVILGGFFVLMLSSLWMPQRSSRAASSQRQDRFDERDVCQVALNPIRSAL